MSKVDSQPLLVTDKLDVEIAGLQICNSLNLTILRGESWGILGRNGVGKTTLLHTLAGLRPASSGSSLIAGLNAHSENRRELARRLGVLFQDNLDPFPATVMESALVGRHPHIPNWQNETVDDQKIVEQQLLAVGMGGYENRLVSTLSGGERQRLAIATLLAQTPDIVLLDEPTNHLDIHYQIGALDLFHRLVREEEKAALMILHDVNMATRYCDNLLLLLGDGEYELGPAKDVLTAESLKRLFDHALVGLDGPNGKVWIPA